MNKITAFGLASFLALLIGCSGSIPQALQNLPTGYSFLDDGVVRIGVVSDLEGAVDNARKAADKLKGQNLDAIIIAGDVYENEQIRRNPVYPSSRDNVKEMVEGIKPFAELGIPVFVIPGNHETQDIYRRGINDLKKNYSTVVDISSGSIDAQGVNIVGLGGYHDRNFIAPGGYLIAPQDYERAGKELARLAQQNEAVILVTHGPPRTDGKIDFVIGAGNVGDLKLNDLIPKATINVHGHIHEGGGNSSLIGSIALNAASVTDYNHPSAPNAALITISGLNASYEFLP